MSRRKSRSPFHGAGKNTIAAYRALAAEVIAWERSVVEGEYYMLPAAWQILGNDGGMEQLRVLDEFESRAWKRLRRQPNFSAMHEARRLAYARAYDPKRYETMMLRRELAGLHREVAEINQRLAQTTGAAVANDDAAERLEHA